MQTFAPGNWREVDWRSQSIYRHHLLEGDASRYRATRRRDQVACGLDLPAAGIGFTALEYSHIGPRYWVPHGSSRDADACERTGI